MMKIPKQELYYVDKWTYHGLENIPIIEENFSELPLVANYYLKELPIHVSPQGIYFTVIKENQILTIFEDVDHKQQELIGQVLLVNDRGLVLKDQNGNVNSLSADYFWVELGNLSEKIKIPAINYDPRPFGPSLIYYDDSISRLFEYNPDKNTWIDTNLNAKNPVLPTQGVNTFYYEQ